MHFFKYGWLMALQQDSLGNLDVVPRDLLLEITQFLSVKDRINFSLLTCKKMRAITDILSGCQAQELIKLFGLEKYMTDEEVIREMKILALVQLRQLEVGINSFDVDFNKYFGTINSKYDALILPRLTIIALSGEEDLKESTALVRKILQQPKRYKMVLKYLTREYFRCRRNQLVKLLKEGNENLMKCRFYNLIDYNSNALMRVYLRDGTKFSLILTAIAGTFTCFYLTVLKDLIPSNQLNFMSLFIIFVVSMSIKMNQYLSRRYETYCE